MEKIVGNISIDSIGYIEDKQELIVRFHNQKAYLYSEIPKEIYNDFKSAKSLGSFLHRYIKGSYRFRSIDAFEVEEKTLNLCDTCIYDFPTCKASPKFGTGFGDDNVYECDEFRTDIS